MIQRVGHTARTPCRHESIASCKDKYAPVPQIMKKLGQVGGLVSLVMMSGCDYGHTAGWSMDGAVKCLMDRLGKLKGDFAASPLGMPLGIDVVVKMMKAARPSVPVDAATLQRIRNVYVQFLMTAMHHHLCMHVRTSLLPDALRRLALPRN